MVSFILVIITFISFCYIPYTICGVNYARIIDNHCYLFKTASDDNNIKNIICIMENTYYVEILLIYDEDFYKVNYNGVSGFVLRNKVKRVTEVPNNPYPTNIKMLTTTNSIYLRSSPEITDNNLSIIPSNCASLNYIGKTYGEQVDDFRQNLWYFVEYQGIYGYVYGDYIVSISNIYPNIEELSFINDNDFDDIINPLSDGTSALIIALMLLPILIIIFLLYKKPKAKKEKFKEKVVVIKEYDEKL